MEPKNSRVGYPIGKARLLPVVANDGVRNSVGPAAHPQRRHISGIING